MKNKHFFRRDDAAAYTPIAAACTLSAAAYTLAAAAYTLALRQLICTTVNKANSVKLGNKDAWGFVQYIHVIYFTF